MDREARTWKLVKMLVGVLMVPLVYALFRSAGDLFTMAWGDIEDRQLVLWSSYGAAFWVGLFLLFHPPMTLYVIGHELTHAGFAWLSGVKVLSFRLHATGGAVEVERTNWLITLAPYFFPIYTVVVLVTYLVCEQVLDIRGLTYFWMLILGLSWAFHMTFTGQMLTRRQSDIEREGYVFSAVVIVFFNLLVVVCWLVCVADVPWTEVFTGFLGHVRKAMGGLGL